MIGDHRSDAAVNTTSGQINVIMESAAKSVNWMDAIIGIQRLSLVTTNGFDISAGCFSRTRCNAVNGNQNNNNLKAK